MASTLLSGMTSIRGDQWSCMQSSRQQQSIWRQDPEDSFWKQGEFPSVDWMVLISSLFCILPLLIPIAAANFLISCIFIESAPCVHRLRLEEQDSAMP